MRNTVTLSIIAIAVIVGLAAMNSSTAKAQTAPTYDYAYAATNFYDAYPLSYEFSNLDSSEFYSWSVFTVDERTGQIVKGLGSKIHMPGTTTDTWTFGVGEGNGSWPENYTGPIRVMDNSGATLGDHYIAPFPFVDGNPENGNDWYATGNQAQYEKLLIGNKNAPGTECQSAIYNPINADGWMHGFIPCQVATFGDDYALLHYQFDQSTYSAPTSDTIVIFQIESTGEEQTLTIDLDDLIEYQVDSAYSTPTVFGFISFIIINTSTNELAFIDYERADAAFTNNPIVNPMRFGSITTLTDDGEDPWGVYTCATFQGASITQECESAWIVTEDPTLQEMYVEVHSDELSGEGNQGFDIRQTTLGFWQGYHGAYTLTDSELGLLDDTVYSFLNLRTGSYQVGLDSADDVSLTFEVEPTLWPSGMTATGAEMAFRASDTYDIVLRPSLEQSVTGLVRAAKFDTEAGRTFLHIVIISIGLIAVGALPAIRANFAAYSLAWTVFGGLAALTPILHSDLSLLMWLLSGILFWILTFTVFKDSLTGARE